MSQIERIYQIHRLLNGRRAPSFDKLKEQLEVSDATLKRDIEFMRNRLGAPIRYIREDNVYRYDPVHYGIESWELPGLWLDSGETRALLLLQDVLDQLHAGLLRDHLRPLRTRLDALLKLSGGGAQDLRKRFRILQAGVRPVDPRRFQTIAGAVLQRHRLRIRYFSRSGAAETVREVSPQRLIYYRANWFLLAWCHVRDGLRSFAVDAIRAAEPLETRAFDAPETDLDACLGAGYGIFAGEARHTAVLRFTPLAARWIESEEWHPLQKRTPRDSGGVELAVPYSDEREILGEILRHGANVEVIAPESLRESVAAALLRAASQYGTARRQPASAAYRGAANQ